MRTTVDLPDDLFRRAKAEAALRGRKLKDLIEEGLRAVVDEQSQHEKRNAGPKRVSVHDLMKDVCGIIKDAPADLSTNPKYFEDFGH